MPASLRSVRRSRLLAVFALVVAVAGASAAAVALTHHPMKPDRGATTTTTTHETTTTTTRPRVTPIGTYSVATTSLTVTVPGLPLTDGQLPTTIWYPVPKGPSLRPHHAHRGFPLLVFSEGYDQPVSSYSALIVDWASAGFVVAGPTYPHTAPSEPTSLDRSPSEFGHHPTDLRAVITAMLAAGRGSGGVLAGKIDAAEIGVVGHSDGGDVSLAVADNSCCRDTAVRAAAILSGSEYKYFGGQYFAPGTPKGPPLLVVQGTNDPTYNPPACSTQLYDAASAPKYFLDLLGATHLDPYENATPWENVVATVTTDFFDAELAGEKAALTTMLTSGTVAQVSQLTEGPSAPIATGDCPTAPGTLGTTPPPPTTTTAAPPPATTTTTTATTAATSTPPTTPTTPTTAATATTATTSTPPSG
jgi:dienelactone hydrolase